MNLSHIAISESLATIPDYIRNPLYQNSLFIALGRFADVGFGFLFWMIAARLYPVADVGIATALVSSLGLVLAFSRLGFDTAIIRFMPSNDHSRVFNTCLWITTIAAVIVSLIYLSVIDIVSPDIAFIRDYAPMFVIFVIVSSITLTTGNALLSFRKANLRFIQNLVMGGRIPLLFVLVLFGSLGIFFSIGFAYLAAAIFALALIRSQVTLSPWIDREFARKTFRFSFLNYLAGLLQSFPTLVMPILIVSVLNPEGAALYYIAFAIGNLVLIIPDALAASFFVEGSHGTNLRKGVTKTLTATYVILVPAIMLVVFFGDLLLGLLGKDYLAAFDLLKVVALSGFIVAVYTIFIPLQNIRLRVEGIVVMNLLRFVLLLGLSYLFLIRCGIIGVGYAWAITYTIMGIGIAVFVKRKGWI